MQIINKKQIKYRNYRKYKYFENGRTEEFYDEISKKFISGLLKIRRTKSQGCISLPYTNYIINFTKYLLKISYCYIIKR